MTIAGLTAISHALQAQQQEIEIRPVQKKSQALDSREPITWDHVYGVDRISFADSKGPSITWISDSKYITQTATGWTLVNASTGEESRWYDKLQLASGLRTIEGITEAHALQMSEGAWRHLLHERQLAFFEHNGQWIRISLDGTEIATVAGIPQNAELASVNPTGTAIAFVSDNDLWVADFSTRKVVRLTTDGSNVIRNGKADWVYFEEVYHRKWNAFKWSPDGGSLLFQQFNDTNVPLFQVIDHTSIQQKVEAEHFPKAGEPNPDVRLGIIQIERAIAANQPPGITWVDMSPLAESELNGAGSIITNIQWSPDSSSVYWYAQDRTQTRLDVVRSSVADGKSNRIWTDKTQAWVDNPGDVTFLKDGSFLIFSERSGWKHLYRIAEDGASLTVVTSGEWEVRSLLAVSEDESFAVVSATRDSHIAENVYRINLRQHGDIVRLTPDDGHHTAKVSTYGSFFVDAWSNLHQATSVDLRNHEATLIRQLQAADQPPFDKYRFGEVQLREVPMADGTTTSAVFVLPPNFDTGTRYPVWLMTYGGPHHPGVKDSFSMRLMEQLLANQEIVVIRFDPRSASGYGAKSAWLAYRKLGSEETRDLVSVCDWLATQTWVDSSRIGMNGHSYGGYFTSYAMTHCDKLCAGIAGAPVTDWANYDTIYTERFMSTPADNPDGYKSASVTEAAANLHGRLLVLHGLMDDNVHPANTIQLVHKLQKANKQFEVMFYPTSRHGIRGTHYDKLLYNFIVDSLGKPESRRE